MSCSAASIEDLVLFGVDKKGIWTNEKKKVSCRSPSPDSGRSSLSSSEQGDSSSDEEPARDGKRNKSKFLHLFKKTSPQKIQTSRKGGDFIFKNEREFFFNEKARNAPRGLGSTRPEDWDHPFYPKKKKDIQEKKKEEPQAQIREQTKTQEHQPQVEFIHKLPPPLMSHPPLPPPVPLMSYPVPPPPQYYNIPPPVPQLHPVPFYHPMSLYPPMGPVQMVPFYPQYPPHHNPYYFY